MTARDDEYLIDKAITGDHLALQKLLISRSKSVANFAARMLPDALCEQVDVDDIVQQVYVEAFRSISSFEPDKTKSFRSWLLGITGNVVKDTVKHHQRAKRGGGFRRLRRGMATESRSVVELVELLSGGQRSPSQSAMAHEAVAAVSEVIDRLPDENRRAVQLRLLEGISLEETAEIMGRSPGAVQGLVDRAKKKMRGALGRLSNYK